MEKQGKLLWNSLKLRVVSGFDGVAASGVGGRGIKTPGRAGDVLPRRRDGRTEPLRRGHGLRVGRDGGWGKAQEWCRKCGRRVQMWKRPWKVEKALESGKAAGNGDKPRNPWLKMRPKWVRRATCSRRRSRSGNGGGWRGCRRRGWCGGRGRYDSIQRDLTRLQPAPPAPAARPRRRRRA